MGWFDDNFDFDKKELSKNFNVVSPPGNLGPWLNDHTPADAKGYFMEAVFHHKLFNGPLATVLINSFIDPKSKYYDAGFQNFLTRQHMLPNQGNPVIEKPELGITLSLEKNGKITAFNPTSFGNISMPGEHSEDKTSQEKKDLQTASAEIKTKESVVSGDEFTALQGIRGQGGGTSGNPSGGPSGR